MEKMMSKRDVIVCRGIWYVVTLLSLPGLYITLNLLLPPGHTSSSSRYVRDGAVSVTTFYAVTLLRYLFFTDPPSTCYKEFTTRKERAPQLFFSLLAVYVLFASPTVYNLLMKSRLSVLYMSLFTISLFTGGIGLIQLSDKFRIEMGHALFTLFFGWLVGLIGIFEGLHFEFVQYLLVAYFLEGIYVLISFWIIWYNTPKDDDLDTSALPT